MSYFRKRKELFHPGENGDWREMYSLIWVLIGGNI